MPTATTVTLADATPTNHDFLPQSVNNGICVMKNHEATTSAGEWTLVLSLNPHSINRPTDKVEMRLTVPTEHLVDDVTKVAYAAKCIVTVFLPEQMTQAERNDFAALTKNMLANADILDYIEELDPFH